MSANPDPVPTAAAKRTPWGQIAIIGAIVLAIVVFLIPSYWGYRPRSMVTEAIVDSAPLRLRIDDFYTSRRSLPEGAEAAGFRLDRDLKEAESVVWNPRERMVVVTMGSNMHRGKRFGFTAEPSGDRLTWTCSTIDLATKYLPANCR